MTKTKSSLKWIVIRHPIDKHYSVFKVHKETAGRYFLRAAHRVKTKVTFDGLDYTVNKSSLKKQTVLIVSKRNHAINLFFNLRQLKDNYYATLEVARETYNNNVKSLLTSNPPIYK